MNNTDGGARDVVLDMLFDVNARTYGEVSLVREGLARAYNHVVDREAAAARDAFLRNACIGVLLFVCTGLLTLLLVTMYVTPVVATGALSEQGCLTRCGCYSESVSSSSSSSLSSSSYSFASDEEEEEEYEEEREEEEEEKGEESAADASSSSQRSSHQQHGVT